MIQAGLVFAGQKIPSYHNEVLRIYRAENGRQYANIEQYGATLATKEHNKLFVMAVNEIAFILNKGLAHVVKPARGASDV